MNITAIYWFTYYFTNDYLYVILKTRFLRGDDILSKNNNDYIEVVEDKKVKSKRKFLKIILIILIVLLVVVVTLVGGFFIGYNYIIEKKLSKINYVDIKPHEIVVNEGVNEKLKGYRNIALLGIDARADTFGKGNRSDCMMIISLNQDTNEVKVASIYRDTYLQIEGHGLDKTNHAYSFGGPKLALDTINANLDLNITEFVAINFDTVRIAVDSVGGIDMSITSEEAGYINGYIDGLNKQFKTNSANITKAGNYHLDGVQALAYSRIRYTSGGDYKRTARMRDVMEKVFEKAKKMGVGELNKLSDEILPHVSTNIDKKEIKDFIPQIAKIKVGEDFGWPYKTEGKMIKGVWYGIPLNLEQNVKDLHKQLFNDEYYEPTATVKATSEKIINATGRK